MGREIRFTAAAPDADRMHHITEDDIRVLLGQLPPEAYDGLRAVHFNDLSWGAKILGYAGHREIALCALPPRMSLARFLVKGESPAYWGARRGTQWPELAIRRFLLYDVFLHELGHLQVVDPRANSPRRRFAREAKAEEFAALWRGRLWKQDFEHADRVHFRPSPEELEALED